MTRIPTSSWERGLQRKALLSRRLDPYQQGGWPEPGRTLSVNNRTQRGPCMKFERVLMLTLLSTIAALSACSDMGSKTGSTEDCEHRSSSAPGCDGAKAAGAAGATTPAPVSPR